MHITWSENVDPEIELRVGPLKQAWEARGAGLLKGIAHRIGEAELAREATIVPCHPQRGGGSADPENGTVRIEAVLVNPVPQLPEVARLGWLLAQLKKQGSSKNVLTQRLALIPAVLEAGEEVELTRYDQASVSLALTQWVGVDASSIASHASVIMQWWEKAQVGEFPWNEQLAALEESLNSAEVSCDSN